ncbi:MAG: fused MFS/spermidine synthase [Gemmatimonas sp.]
MTKPSVKLLPLLLLLFVGSGMCALIYEVVWFQLLGLVIGSSAVSLGVLLATFMGGMCLGSLYLPRFIDKKHHPLKVYAYLELGIGICGLVVLYLVPLVGNLYTLTPGQGFIGITMRAVVAGICLLPPTIMMGATLPAVARWIEATPKGVSWLGFFYGGNTAGAVLGAVLAGFYLLRKYDMSTATMLAAAVNIAIFFAALSIAGNAPAMADTGSGDELETNLTTDVPGAKIIYLVIGMSGLCALGSEVVWTRLLSLMLGASTYTFSLILAVFLTGLGVGSAAGAALARALDRPQFALGCAQALQMLGIAWAAFMLAVALPNWPVNPSLSPGIAYTFHVDLTKAMWVVLPSACLWGMSFPLALAALATRAEDTGKLAGKVYAANTFGAIIGSLAFSLLIVPRFGTHAAEQLLLVLSGVSALLAFSTLWLPARVTATAALLTTAGVLIAFGTNVPKIPDLLVAYGRYMVTWLGRVEIVYVGEGINSSIAVSKLGDTGATQFHVAGKVEASSLPQDMRLQRMLGHLPALVHPEPKSVLIVGFGAGVTSGSFVPYPSISRIVICELEPLIPQVVSTYFANENNRVKDDPRTQIYYDDARSFIITTKEKFDIITSDPIHPWVKGAASLYTEEYFEAVKEHLNPGGVVTQWVPLYESNMEAVKSEVATFLKVFPNGSVWANNVDGKGYDVVMLAGKDSLRININQIEERLRRADYQQVVASLVEVGFNSSLTLFSTYATQASDLTSWMADAEINRDRNLRLQYLAGFGLNAFQGDVIFSSMAAGRKYPSNLFVADSAWTGAMQGILGSPQ